MSRRNPPAKWVLPNTVDPPTSTCWMVPVPDDPFHRAAFWGALLDLASAYKWADDPAHTAKQVALVWRDIVDNLQKCPPPPAPPAGGIIEDFEMPIRVDCDCNVFVTCCDGTEVQLATVPMLKQGPQPGGGAPQPQPGGGTAGYDGCLNANELWLIPTPLSTGDVITLSNTSGAATGNAGTTWNCPDGSVYFAGGCLAIGATVGTDPLPTTNHMALILQLDGDYYDLSAGPVTVPSGVDNVQGWIQVNDDDLTDNSGTECFSVTVQNNQAGTFQHSFNFITNNDGWTVRDIGQYTPGQGFQAVYSAPIMTADIQSPIVAAFTLTRMQVHVINSGQSGGSNIAFGKNTPGVYFYNVTNNDGDQLYDTGIISETGVTRLFVDAFLDTSLATGTIKSIVLNGEGADPF